MELHKMLDQNHKSQKPGKDKNKNKEQEQKIENSNNYGRY